MAVRKIINMGHPTLRKVARPVTDGEIDSHEFRRLIADMIDTLADYGGIGLAAPQINESIRLAILNVPAENRYTETGESMPLTVCINPKITILQEDLTAGYWEGCLSVPGLRGWVERPQKLNLQFTDEKRQQHNLEINGFLATVCQHEFDHLDGVLYIDRIEDTHKLMFEREFLQHIEQFGDTETLD